MFFAFQVDLLLDEGTGLNVLMNNAGCMIAEGGTLENADRSVYLQHFDTNVISVAKMIEVNAKIFIVFVLHNILRSHVLIYFLPFMLLVSVL